MTRSWRIAAIAGSLLSVACSSQTDSSPPPTGATLAFAMDNSIYLVTTSGTAKPSLLMPRFTRPSWSPDGTTLAMVAGADPLYGALYLTDADGTDVRKLTEFAAAIPSKPLWSPDGTTLLFVRSVRNYPQYDSVARVAATGGAETTIDSVGPGAEPSLSHDGSLLALDLIIRVRVIDIATRDGILELAGTSPRFSPLRDEIAFRELNSRHIHVAQLDGTDRDLEQEGYPQSWSPDGTRLAFVGLDGALYTMKADKSGLARIGPLDVAVSDFVWSPDGQQIAYVTRTFAGQSSIVVARQDDSDQRPIVTAAGLCCLSWRP